MHLLCLLDLRMPFGQDLIVIVSVASVFCLALAGFWLVLSFICCCKGAKKPSDEAADTDPLLSPYDIVHGGEEYQYTKEDLAYIKETKHFLVKAQFDFQGTTGSSELNFKSGQYVWVTNSQSEDGWWVGKIYGTDQEGYFPKTYVQILTSPKY